MNPQLFALGPTFERECRYVVSGQVFPTKLRFLLQADSICDLFFRSRKRLFITLLSTSAYLAFCYLAAGTVPCVTLPPPPEVAEAAPVGTPQPGITNESTSTPMAVPTVSRSEDVTTSVVSCLGDSITNGYPYWGTASTYPARLQAQLDAAHGPGSFDVINHGVDGYRADQVLKDLQDLNWMAEDPDFVLLMVGGNDLTQEAGGDPAKLPEVISRTVGEVQDIVNVVITHTNADGSHPQIIVSAIIPTTVTLESLAVWSYNSRLESDLTGVDLWITGNWDDFYDPLTGHARESLMYDSVHPNADGYLVMAENWFEALESLVQKRKVYLPLVLRDR